MTGAVTELKNLKLLPHDVRIEKDPVKPAVTTIDVENEGKHTPPASASAPKDAEPTPDAKGVKRSVEDDSGKEPAAKTAREGGGNTEGDNSETAPSKKEKRSPQRVVDQ